MQSFAPDQLLGVLLAQTGNPPAPDLDVNSVGDFVLKGGPVMIPIILCSLVAMAILAERLISLRRGRIIPPGFVAGLQGVLRDPSADRAAALAYCEKDPSPIAAVCAIGIRRLGEPIDLLERHISEAGERQVQRLKARLRILAVIASIAPLLGLLGTIFGMILAFQTVAVSAEALGKTELLAKGIYQAMITTAAGLIVAIPVLICHHWLSAIVDRRIAEIDRLASDFVERYALAPAPALPASARSVEPDPPVVHVPAATHNGQSAAPAPSLAGATA